MFTVSGSTTYYTIADDTSLSLPDGDWSIGVIASTTSEVQSFPVIFANGVYNTNNTVQIFRASSTDRWWLHARDGDGTVNEDASTNTFATGATRYLFVAQRSTGDSELQCWIGALGGTMAKECSFADTSFNAFNGGTWYLGRESSANSDTRGDIGEFWVNPNSALTQAQLDALCQGASPLQIVGADLSCYVPFHTNNTSEYDVIGDNTATKNGSPAAGALPPVMAEAMPIYVEYASGGVASNPKGPLGMPLHGPLAGPI